MNPSATAFLPVDAAELAGPTCLPGYPLTCKEL